MRAIKKITVDTNILISFFVYPSGIVREIISLAIKKHIIICVSPDILEEYAGVLRLKFGWTEQDINANISLLKKMTQTEQPKTGFKVVHADPTDDKIIECAVAAGADAIVSGDKHLLDMKKYRSIVIMKPAELLKEISRR